MVVVTPRVGVGGGGADTTWESGSVAQPERSRLKAPHQASTGRRNGVARAALEFAGRPSIGCIMGGDYSGPAATAMG
jgi:hypothetical protein